MVVYEIRTVRPGDSQPGTLTSELSRIAFLLVEKIVLYILYRFNDVTDPSNSEISSKLYPSGFDII